ncbi:AAA family ATPase [Pseudomonas viridiflava]|uniref:AAA family ATPase n=1 Tax=Pseudomonas viridiflava TaxID=33069 RepID=UPI002A6AF9BE|nr:AAA family ATPase [Pseudomonas viridiflava]MDY0936172.1 AAA family ATPase [Pseudomonas viridiflava]MDY1014208.1 AAA family ATPase [Pseudomonas viridiflava]
MNNMPIKFLAVTIQNFRGIPDELVVPLDAPLTVIHAANGTGKSTICYALEWLITGKVDDLNGAALECQWGKGATTVSAKCLIEEKLHVLTRTNNSLWITQEGEKKKKINDEVLLEMLTPPSISGKSTIALRKAKRGWLRNSRWLYSNSLALLIDNNKADERQQIFADILGFGHLTSTLRDLHDYRKALPNTKGVADKVASVNTEIETLKMTLAISSPAKDTALSNLDAIFTALPPAVEGSISERLGAAQLRVKSFSHKQQREMAVLNTVYEQWTQYHSSLQQIGTLRQSVDALALEQKHASEDQVVRASELSEAQQRVSDAERSTKWADDRLLTLQGWQSVTAVQSVGEYFQKADLSQAELTAEFVELGWSSERQEQWKEATALLSANVQKIMELERQKNDLTANPVAPVIDYEERVRLADAAKNVRVRAEADFDAFSNVLGKLKVMGSEVAHNHDDAHCPLCNYDWRTTDKLRKEISSNMEVLAPTLEAAAGALTQARQKEQDAVNALALATSQKSAYDAYLSRSSSVGQELQSFATRTKYFEIMGVQDFSEMNFTDLASLNSRVTSAIQLSGIFKKLAEVEKFFGTIPSNVASTRVSTAVESLVSYKKHFQDQFDQYEPVRTRLVLVVQGLLQAVQSKANEIAGLNTSIAAAVEITSNFDSHWRELFGDQSVLVESYELMRQQLGQRGNDVTKYSGMLDQCEAVVSVDTDSAKLKKLEQELVELSSKLKIGTDYIAKADQAIEQYALHVKDFTASSLKPLLSPAAELFSRMHANEVYKGLGVSEGEDALKWTVFAEGHEPALDAEGKLSQGQRQDLALSLYLARARNTGGSFFLDEPIAHLDDLNRVAMLDIFRLVATSMPSMNLILTTASDSLARHMAQKFSSITDKHLLNMIHLEGNPRTGVKMTVQRNAVSSTQPS